MTTEFLSRNVALRRILSDGIDAVLVPAGFERRGRRAWLRQTSELQHVIALDLHHGAFAVQWGVVSPEVVPYLWGNAGKEGDVAWSAMTSWASDIMQHPSCWSFRLDEAVPGEEIERITASLSADLELVERYLRPFSTRRELRAYLMANRDQSDSRGFLIPSGLPLKLFTAAALAVVDRDPDARELIADTEHAMAPYRDDLTRARLDRLKAGAAGLKR